MFYPALETSQYHYTLYYYDQAGNLTRTVPPEGVHLLDPRWVDQVDLARDQANTVCTYTGPSANTDKALTLGYIEATLASPGNNTIEMWLNNTEANRSASQVLATSANKKFLLNVCLFERYLNIDIYSLKPSADGKDVEIDTSWHTTADMLAALPQRPWIHVAILKSGVNKDDLSVYVNGISVPLSTEKVYGGCGWEISTSISGAVYPENFANLKHIRIYNRHLTSAEIAANAAESCMSISPAYAASLESARLHWGRFNTPAIGSSGTIAGTTTETSAVPLYPEHGLATSYAYQSLNGITKQKTPDSDTSRFWYDRLGRMVASQNAEQKSPYSVGFVSNRFSYTKYDGQDRIIEVGEKTGVTSPAIVPFLSQTEVNSFLTSGTNRSITQTYYDAPFTGTASRIPQVQENLRKRVSAVLYKNAATDSLEQATYYSYDQLGNVKTLWQQMYLLSIKQIDYQYDLVSGKVNKVRYQPGQMDQFYYGYEYDAENRLTNAFTGIRSTSSDNWDIENKHKDAGYQYYLHGPLARTELGNMQLAQGLDYAYTLQGWLKGVNGNYLVAGNDIGRDGAPAGFRYNTARDAFAYSLDYYKGDYRSIGSNANAFPLSWTAGQSTEAGRNLFNGNISRSTVALKRIKEGEPVGYTYRYDQLNRLTGMCQHPLTAGATGWDASSAGEAYKEAVTYDGNGNILSYLRNGSGANGKPVAMDQLSYVYQKDNFGNLVHNKLLQVTDAVTAENYSSDIKSQADTNYIYDKIGNLVKNTKDSIRQIRWTVYGKIERITKADNSYIEYKYDASGNRVFKLHSHGGTFDRTWYVRDAQGNVLAVYDNKNTQLHWQEQHLYGSSRLGVWNVGLASTSSATAVNNRWQSLGTKRFELSNHLGNVLMTISDKVKDSVIGGVVDHTEAEILSAQDYYPFGMLQPDRQWSLGSYRYGFNGKENDNEVKGEGNQQDYGMRVYDGRLGKFLSVDPITQQYPELTPYQFASNRVIDGIDRDGLEFEWAIEVFKKVKSGYETSIEKIDEGYTAAVPYLEPVGRGMRKAAKVLAPIRPVEADDPQTIGEALDNFTKIPSNLAKMPSQVKRLYTEGTTEQKIEGTTAMVLSLAGMLKGKPATKIEGVALASTGINWSWKSVKTFRHAFSKHGAKNTIEQIADMARASKAKGSVDAIGQWLDNTKAAAWIASKYETLKEGENIIDIPAGLGRVVKYDKTTIEAAKAIVVKEKAGSEYIFSTAYPVINR